MDDQNLSFKLEDPFFLDMKAYKPLNFSLNRKKISLPMSVLHQQYPLVYTAGEASGEVRLRTRAGERKEVWEGEEPERTEPGCDSTFKQCRTVA